MWNHESKGRVHLSVQPEEVRTMANPWSGAGVAPTGQPAPPLSARVWLLASGRFGRVVTRAQGGLTCRVRLEGDGLVVDCLGSELLELARDAGT